MSQEHALDRANYVRMCVEQRISENSRKSFVLLLHYSISSAVQSRCYPALFLGGWKHVFIDGVGNSDPAFDVTQFIALACGEANLEEKLKGGHGTSVRSPRECIRALLPRVLSSVATEEIFYRQQCPIDKDSYDLRKNLVDRVLLVTVGDESVSEILCDKFLQFWMEKALVRTAATASEGLLDRTTQLSMSMSVYSVLVQTFRDFLTDILVEANQWLNLDILLTTSLRQDVAELFGIILRHVSVSPFNEMVLQRQQSTIKTLSRLPETRVASATVQFPFFSLISAYLDEVVEKVSETLLERFNPDESDRLDREKVTSEQCFQAAVELIQTGESAERELVDQSTESERRKVVLAALHFVEKNRPSCGMSLFECYIRQYVEWRVGCPASPALMQWLHHELGSCGPTQNLVAVHVIARLERIELMRMASLTFLSESLPQLGQHEKGLDSGTSKGLPMDEDGLLQQSIDLLERTLTDQSVPQKDWELYFSSFLIQARGLLIREKIEVEKCCVKLRVLSFLYVLRRSTSIPDALKHASDLWLGDGSPSRLCDYTIERFLDSLGVSRGKESWNQLAVFLLRHFFSPSWMKTVSLFRKADFDFLLSCISDGTLSGPNHQLAVSLLHIACEGEDDLCPYGVFSADALLRTSSALTCETSTAFSKEGKRKYTPSFIPEWLRDFSSRLTGTGTGSSPIAFPSIFREYKHSFTGELSEVVFDMFLSAFSEKAEQASSEDLFLILVKECESEDSLDRQTHTQISRLRATDQRCDLRGTPLAAIALSVRMVCFVAKLAQEISANLSTVAFSGAYSRDAKHLFCEIMSLPTTAWQDFFISTILRLRGDGTLMKVLEERGPLCDMACFAQWSRAMWTTEQDSGDALRLAETSLAEATAEEERKAREMRCCPHCRQPFIVDQANCGQFICGRDAHLWHGQAQVAGTVVRDTYGCGQNFSLSNATNYVVDEAVLGPLRDQIARERSRLELCGSLWKRARSFVVPPLLHHVQNDCSGQCMLPCSSLISSLADEDKTTRDLVKVLWNGAALSSLVSLLPDLIEVSFDFRRP
jgi:hypothetical protein